MHRVYHALLFLTVLSWAPRYPFLHAEVVFAAQQEYACRAVDVLARRTRLAFLDKEAAQEAAPMVVKLLASTLVCVRPLPLHLVYMLFIHSSRWSRSKEKEELEDIKVFLETMQVCRPN